MALDIGDIRQLYAQALHDLRFELSALDQVLEQYRAQAEPVQTRRNAVHHAIHHLEKAIEAANHHGFETNGEGGAP